MIFTETPLPGAYLIELELRKDERGSFARSFCREVFQIRGLRSEIAQCNISRNHSRGTLRGMHYQAAPRSEAKLVRCSRGALYDVIIDLRSESPGYCRWFGIELTEANHRMLYIPEGFAHGFQTLADETEVFYHMFESYAPELALGVRWDDPAFGIIWPIANPILSDRDRTYPLLSRIL